MYTYPNNSNWQFAADSQVTITGTETMAEIVDDLKEFIEESHRIAFGDETLG